MSDSGTDAFVGVVAALVLAVAVFAAASGNPLTSSARAPSSGGTSRSATPRPTVSTTPSPTTNIPGGTLLGCSGEVISDETVSTGGQAINLRVYYSSAEGGRNCAVARKVGDTVRSRGPLVVSLRFADSRTRTWPQYAEHRSSASAGRSGSVYLDRTDDRCVRAEARFTPADGKPVSVRSGRTGCD